jgi:hypothetical protein
LRFRLSQRACKSAKKLEAPPIVVEDLIADGQVESLVLLDVELNSWRRLPVPSDRTIYRVIG